jgi:hypothetical protein
VRQVPEDIALDRDDSDVCGGDRFEELLHRRPSVAEADGSVDAELADKSFQVRPIRAVAIEIDIQPRDLFTRDGDGPHDLSSP